MENFRLSKGLFVMDSPFLVVGSLFVMLNLPAAGRLDSASLFTKFPQLQIK